MEMRGAWEIVVAIAVSMSFLVSGASVLTAPAEAAPYSPWTAHAPIVIDGNGNFTSANGVVRGSGVAYDPYVIEGLLINSTDVPCIEIRNTTAHVLVTDMYLRNYHMNATDRSVYISNSSNVQLANLITYGIGEEWPSDPGPFLRLDSCSNISVLAQTDNGQRSLEVNDSDNVTIAGGAYTSYLEFITLTDSENVTISKNRIDAYLGYDVIASGCRNVLVTENDFGSQDFGTSGTGYGFWVCGCVNVSIYHNNIYGISLTYDDHTIVTDVPAELHMDSGYPGGGNYWELYPGADNFSGPDQNLPSPDGIRDTPLTLGSDTDFYPLMNPLVWYTPIPQYLWVVSESDHLLVGQAVNVTVAFLDQYGFKTYSGPEVLWANMFPTIALVTVNQTNSSRAVVTGLSAGNAAIYFHAGTLNAGPLDFNVSFGLTSLGISSSGDYVDFGNTTTFEAVGENPYGRIRWLPAEWGVDPANGSIDSEGGFTANKFSGTITGYGDATVLCKITASLDNQMAQRFTVIRLHNYTDHDSDGILDWKELMYGLDPFNVSDAQMDYDHDWLTNARETELYTFVYDSDTDDDNLSDGFEVVFSKTSPTDLYSNGHGIPDGAWFAAAQKYAANLSYTSNGDYGMSIAWEGNTINAEVSSTVNDASFDVKELTLRLNLSGGPESGQFDIRIPSDLCEGDDITLHVDGVAVNQSARLVGGYYEFSYEYPSGSHELVLKFAKEGVPSVYWALLALVLVLGFALTVIIVRKLRKP